MLNKVDGIRRKLKKILDKRSYLKKEEELAGFEEESIQKKVKGLDKKS